MGLTPAQVEFAHDASHRLRDPITMCRGHLELIETDDDREEQRKTIALVLTELDRMGRIVDDLQVLAESGGDDFLRPAPIHLAPFTYEIAAQASELGPRRWALDAAAEGTIVADEYLLSEALLRLARNAVEHTRPSETVAVGSSLDEDEARLWVRDTGCGIAAADQAVLFDYFTRGADAHRRYRGSGLGLPIVKEIAETHGGRVELESTPGDGATFTIVLPCRVSDQAGESPRR